MLAYNLPAFLQGDATRFLAGLARVSGLIKKVGIELDVTRYGMLMARQRGVLDHAGAARIVLRDWSAGTLMRHTMPEETPGETGETGEGDEAVLEAVRSRKELRKNTKLVRMDTGVNDARDLEWDVEWEEEEEEPGRVLK